MVSSAKLSMSHFGDGVLPRYSAVKTKAVSPVRKEVPNVNPDLQQQVAKNLANVNADSSKYQSPLNNLQNQVNSVLDKVGNVVKPLFGNMSDNVVKPLLGAIGSIGSSTSPQTGSSAKPIVYSDWSPAAKQFGMDQQTAYSEHMVNTAHQREVADLRAAGLNPVLGVGSGASGVSGHTATSLVGSSAQKSLNGDFIVDAIGATAAVVTAILTKNPSFGYMAGSAVNAVGDLFTKLK